MEANIRIYFCTLPKRNWAQYFNSKIDYSNEVTEEEEENTVDGSDDDEDEGDDDSNPTDSEEDYDSEESE